MIGLDAAAEHSVDRVCLGTSLTPPTCDVTEYFKVLQQGFYTTFVMRYFNTVHV